jgi:prevent-host-death family protein
MGSYGSAVCETIKQAELRNNNAEIMRRVAAGESFTVTVHGQPVADLVPHQRLSRGRRRLVPASEFDAALAALPPSTWSNGSGTFRKRTTSLVTTSRGTLGMRPARSDRAYRAQGAPRHLGHHQPAFAGHGFFR